jgi:hypothetical protein
VTVDIGVTGVQDGECEAASMEAKDEFDGTGVETTHCTTNEQPTNMNEP